MSEEKRKRGRPKGSINKSKELGVVINDYLQIKDIVELKDELTFFLNQSINNSIGLCFERFTNKKNRR